MSRPLRIEYKGAIYHVMNRGRRGEDVFYDDGDRYLLRQLVGLIVLPMMTKNTIKF